MLFEADAPYYLSLGMSYGDYWYGDVWMIEAVREADKRNRQRKSEEMWLQGVYVFNAVSAALANAFRGKGKPPYEYMEEPVRVVPYTEAEKEARAERERQKVIEYFDRLAKKWEKQSKPS